jgi:hypothetical protein
VRPQAIGPGQKALFDAKQARGGSGGGAKPKSEAKELTEKQVTPGSAASMTRHWCSSGGSNLELSAVFEIGDGLRHFLDRPRWVARRLWQQLIPCSSEMPWVLLAYLVD